MKVKQGRQAGQWIGRQEVYQPGKVLTRQAGRVGGRQADS